MIWLDRICAGVVLLGAIGHSFGSFAAYSSNHETLLWALSGSALAGLVGAINLLRSFRPPDKSLAGIALAGVLAWMAASICFGLVIGNVIDSRVVAFVIACAGLTYFNLRALLA